MDWKNPDYAAIVHKRMAMLRWLRERPDELPALKQYYRAHPADFISDWGVTFDPRNADVGRPTIVPFVLFPRQREWVEFVIRKWRAREPAITEKSRDMGISWLAMSLSCTICLFEEGVAIGVGSRKAEYVDKVGTMKPLLPKGRMFMEHLPKEFRGEWQSWRDAPTMRITFPATGSIIGGEGGDDIGRGDRTSIYFVDEAAHIEHPELVDASLSQTTNCRIDMSSVNGSNNSFAKRRHAGKIEVFIFDWHDDPRKDDAWYAKMCEEHDEVTVAQEIDRDYHASVHGIVIPGAWVRSAIDALRKLGIAPTGERRLAFDVADEGVDKNAWVGATGVQIDFLDLASGKGGDIFASVEHTFEVCDREGYRKFRYDSDGLGAGVRGDARVVNEKRAHANAPQITAEGFRGSEAVLNPEGIVEGTIGREGDKGRSNQDYFANRKAQMWWSLRRRFQLTHRWVQAVASGDRLLIEKARCDPDKIISLHPKMPLLQQLVAELSQPTYAVNGVGKIVINKKPDGMPSPNLGDGAMIVMAEGDLPPVLVSAGILQQIRAAPRRRPY